MANTIECYKEAWKGYSGNLKPFALNGLVLFVVTFALVPLAILAGVAPGLAMSAMPGARQELVIIMVGLSVVLPLLVGAVINVFAKAFYGVCADLLDEKTVGWHALLGHVRRNWATLAGISILQMGAVFLVALVFVIEPVAILPNAIPSPFSFILIALLVLLFIPLVAVVAMLFEPAYPIAIIECRGVFDAIGKGFGLVIRNFWQFIILAIISFFVDLLNFIPFAQQVVTIPLNCAALLIFYKTERQERRRVR